MKLLEVLEALKLLEAIVKGLKLLEAIVKGPKALKIVRHFESLGVLQVQKASAAAAARPK